MVSKVSTTFFHIPAMPLPPPHCLVDTDTDLECTYIPGHHTLAGSSLHTAHQITSPPSPSPSPLRTTLTNVDNVYLLLGFDEVKGHCQVL